MHPPPKPASAMAQGIREFSGEPVVALDRWDRSGDSPVVSEPEVAVQGDVVAEAEVEAVAVAVETPWGLVSPAPAFHSASMYRPERLRWRRFQPTPRRRRKKRGSGGFSYSPIRSRNAPRSCEATGGSPQRVSKPKMEGEFPVE